MILKIKNTAFLWGTLSLLCSVSGAWSMDPGPNEDHLLSLSKRKADSSSSAPKRSKRDSDCLNIMPKEVPPTLMVKVLEVINNPDFFAVESWLGITCIKTGLTYSATMKDISQAREGPFSIAENLYDNTGIAMNFDIDTMNIDQFYEALLQTCIQGQLISEGTKIGDVKCAIRYRNVCRYIPHLSSRVVNMLDFDGAVQTQFVPVKNLTNLENILLRHTMVHRFPFCESNRIRGGRIKLDIDDGDCFSIMPLAPRWVGGILGGDFVPACEDGGRFFKGWKDANSLNLFSSRITPRLAMSIANCDVSFEIQNVVAADNSGSDSNFSDAGVQDDLDSGCNDGKSKMTSDKGASPSDNIAGESSGEAPNAVNLGIEFLCLPPELFSHVVSFSDLVDRLYLEVSLKKDVLRASPGPMGTWVSSDYDIVEKLIEEDLMLQKKGLSLQELVGVADEVGALKGFALSFHGENGCVFPKQYSVEESFTVAKQSEGEYVWTGVWNVTEADTPRRSKFTFGPIETRKTDEDDCPYTKFPDAMHFRLCLHTICLDLLTAYDQKGEIKLVNNVNAHLIAQDNSEEIEAGPAESSSESSDSGGSSGGPGIFCSKAPTPGGLDEID